ncbi:flavin reductase family protein [Williamsia phyllosphaerae]|uniref:Flavin reductase n=1 Tax=Williamsia phyllosphaerae TaxID=885042 RepID=A0ABQ1U7Y9_9NOCA|nr:flavin reductase family protein [Williamsia phyllosphaerae]GGF11410.1 flavin reductase [Williamsia phyllosphaerae]
MVDTAPAPIDAQLFREVMGHYPTGVVIVTGTTASGDILAMVVGSFNSVSLDPPLVSFMPMKTSRTYAAMQECSSLCINILGSDQEELVLTIAQRWENKLDGIDWHESPSGDPVLARSVAWVDVAIENTVEAGDHWIVLCAIRQLAVTNPVSPLIFFQGGYGSFVCTSLMARMDHDTLPAITVAHGAREALEALAAEIGCEVTVFTTVSEEEVATVFSATGPGIDRVGDFGRRIPMVPPVGDTYYFDKAPDCQQRWLDRLRGADEEAMERFRARLSFLDRHGYSYSILPDDAGRDAYGAVREATELYSNGRITPAQWRLIRDSMVNSAVDYRVSDLDDTQSYSLGSLVLPVRDQAGVHTMTLRLAMLPPSVTRARIEGWLDRAKTVVAALEADDRQQDPMTNRARAGWKENR